MIYIIFSKSFAFLYIFNNAPSNISGQGIFLSNEGYNRYSSNENGSSINFIFISLNKVINLSLLILFFSFVKLIFSVKEADTLFLL